ncbi:ribonuclease HepT family protein [Methyloversatilis thermotolerans]|uniref:hypothetical protein n=1 Tax=Methyloversatilis thermotolerans TaxID=1346290 RepID=UPI00035DB2B8
MLTAALLANFFEAGWSVQVLLGDMDRSQYLSSRLARPQIEKHLRTMAETAGALPEEIRRQMPNVDWASWAALASALPPNNAARMDRVWTAITEWLPPTGLAMRQYRFRMPELFAFRLPGR